MNKKYRVLKRLMPENSLSRRDFLKSQAGLAAAVAFSGLGVLGQASVSRAGNSPDIGVARGGPTEAVRACVDLMGGMSSFVSSGDKVVIKPNMSFAHTPDRATNTNPRVVSALAEMCVDAGASRVMVLDNTLQSAQRCMELSGIRDACADIPNTRVETFDSRRFFQEVSIPEGESFRSTEVMRDVLDADVLIAAPVAKSHSATGVSVSMKGMMGLIRNRGVMHSRYNLNQAIVDLCTLLKADLTVVDATRVLSSHGPQGPGDVIEGELVLASRDMVAADAKTVELFPWYGRKIRPDQVEHIKMAHERGLGRMDLDNLEIQTVDA
ncbi:DUF362 domain-containing protein [Desulfonatronospira sp. MSAO_Bac3]|uniref:DUF362 domain-containing protein n=1 Tax=Desulfonatronospira sp. MSAO_Bac3 TaxID=2293857 RepID=UPI000FEE8C42|nr:DUF362 domain-containing protein [Desulfonatronospira sp. MSAO_Bac3]RQD74503.1 MAG: DUF362 domain-containing protein [Desulfonatronospira sp. MSAO_Bac3]